MTKKLRIGLAAGLILGLLDGLSTWFAPEVPSTIGLIVVSATLKGVVNGGLLAVVSRWIERPVWLVVAGGLLGLVLSALAAIPSGSYIEVIIPGVVVGLLIGAIIARWGR